VTASASYFCCKTVIVSNAWGGKPSSYLLIFSTSHLLLFVCLRVPSWLKSDYPKLDIWLELGKNKGCQFLIKRKSNEEPHKKQPLEDVPRRDTLAGIHIKPLGYADAGNSIQADLPGPGTFTGNRVLHSARQ
jgi:hypothetical protein